MLNIFVKLIIIRQNNEYDFRNICSQVGQIYLYRDRGIALWISSCYLYSNIRGTAGIMNFKPKSWLQMYI